MIDLMMSSEQDVTLFLERMTGGPLDELECADDVAIDAFFAMTVASHAADSGQRAAR